MPLGFYVLSNALSNRFCYENAPMTPIDDAQYSVIFSHRSMNKVPPPPPPLLYSYLGLLILSDMTFSCSQIYRKCLVGHLVVHG